MLKGLTNTFKNNCNATEVVLSEYLILGKQTIPIKAELSDDCYENGNFIGTFILKSIKFQTDATYNFKNKEFEYYKVVNGESIKIGTFITTEVTISDTNELVSVVGMDYGLKTQVQYTSSLDYASGTITLLDVWNEACTLSGLESGITNFPNSDFIVDSDQFTGTGATIRDVFKGIAMSSGTFVKVMNDDKIYLVFTEYTSENKNLEVNGSTTIQDGLKLDSIELQGNTSQNGTPTPDAPVPVNVVTGDNSIKVCGKNLFDVSQVQIGVAWNNTSNSARAVVYAKCEPNTKYTISFNNISNFDGIFNFEKVSTTSATATSSVSSLTSTKTITTNSTSQYIGIQFNKSDISLNDFDGLKLQIEKGSTATEYEAYKEQSYEINLGKNLFDKSNITTGKTYTGTGDITTLDNSFVQESYIPVTPSTAYTISTTNNYSNTTDFRLQIIEYGSSQNFIRRDNGTAGGGVTTKYTITTSSTTHYVRLGANTITKDELQFEKGQATSYAPYKTPIELCKIGNYQDSIRKGTGKNVLPNNITSQSINGLNINVSDDGTITINGTANALTYLDLTTNFNSSTYAGYKFYGFPTNSQRIGIRVSKSNRVSLQDVATDGITLTDNGEIYIAVRIERGRTLNNYVLQPMLMNTEPTSYEPYNSKGKWLLTKKIGKVVLDGSENGWGYDSAKNYFRCPSYTYDNLPTSATQNRLSKYFTNVVDWKEFRDNTTLDGMHIEPTGYKICIRNTNYTLTNDFKNWLSTHNTTVYYVLATPTVEEITDSTLINQLENVELLDGVNNISISSNDLPVPLELTYYNNELDIIEDYTELEDKRDTHPWTCLRLGMSQIDGENVDYIDQELVEEYGENWLILNDNPFAYNQTKRQQLITAIFNQIKAFGYSAFSSKTSFKPYLTCGDVIQFRNRNGELVKTIVLRYNHNGEEITLEAPSETSATINYVYPLSAVDIAKRTQIEVDKEKGQITSLVENVGILQTSTSQNADNINRLTSMVNSQGENIEALGTRITQTADSINASVSAIQSEIDEGVGLVKTTSVTIDDSGLNVSTDTSKISTTMTNNSFEIKDNGDKTLAFFGYDEQEGISKAEMDNLTVTNYFIAGVHRVETIEVDGEERTGYFYIGG